MFQSLPLGNVLAFADDTCLMCSGETWQSAVDQINHCLNVIFNWLYENQLSLNLEKTVYMAFGNCSSSVPENLHVVLDGVSLTRVESTKYLGVIIDYRLKWKLHIEYVTKRTKYLLQRAYTLSLGYLPSWMVIP